MSRALPFGLSKNLAAGLILLLAIALFMLLRATAPDAQVQTKTEPVFTVRTQAVTPAPHRPLVRLYGTVVAPSRAQLTAAVSADVQEVLALAGDQVAAQQLLIRLDPAEAEIAVSQARAELQQAEAQLRLDAQQRASNRLALENERRLLSLSERAVARAVNLSRRGALSEAQLDETKQNFERQKLALQQRQLAVEQAEATTAQLQAQVSMAEARLQRAELDLQRTEIRAPFNGSVIRTQVAPGDRVSPGTPLIELYDRERVEIRAQIPSRHIAQLRTARAAGLPLNATVFAAGERHPARLARLAASGGGGGQDGYFSVLGDVLAIDANVSLELTLPAEAASVPVPYNAVYDLSRIFRVVDGRLESLGIEQLGDYRDPDSGDLKLLVRSAALRPDDRIVLTQLPNAVTGLKVQTLEP